MQKARGIARSSIYTEHNVLFFINNLLENSHDELQASVEKANYLDQLLVFHSLLATSELDIPQTHSVPTQLPSFFQA